MTRFNKSKHCLVNFLTGSIAKLRAKKILLKLINYRYIN